MRDGSRVADVFEGVRRHLVGRWRRAVLVWGAVGALVVLLAAWILAGAEGWSAGTPGPLLLDAGLVVLVGVAWWGLRALARRWLSERRVAGSMEEAAGLGGGTVRGALEMARAVPPGVSERLAAVAERGVARRLELSEERLSGRLGADARRWSRRGWRTLALVGPLVILAGVVAPGRAVSAWLGLGTPLRLLARPMLPALVVEPGDAEVLRGSDAGVDVVAVGREQVTLHWQAAGDVARTETAPVAEDRARFTLREVRAPVEYWVGAPDGIRTRTYRITPVDPLFVSDVTLEVSFPPHTGRPPEEYHGDVPPLTVPVGTRLRIEGRASRPLGGARLLDAEGSTALALELEGPAFQATWRPTVSGVYRWDFVDGDGGAAEAAPTPLDLTLVADSVPEVRITFPGRDTVLPLDQRQPLVLEARDDYGVRTLELVAWRVTSLGESREPVVQSLELGANRGVMARPVLDVSAWGLLPGDTVRYLARATDNSPAGHTATSREYRLWMPGVTDLRREAQDRLEEAARGVEELAGKAAEAAEDTRDLERQTASGRNGEEQRSSPFQRRPAGDERAGFQEREDVRQALERQSELQSSVDSVRNELEELARAMEEAGASDPELDRDLQELQELLSDALTPEMRERLQEVMEKLDGMDVRQAAETLGDLREDQEAMRERLEASLERFRRAAVEQDFRATTEEAAELAREERALGEAMREDRQPESRAGQQEEIGQRTEEMESRMERLQERLQKLGEQDAAKAVEGARQQAAESRAEMERAGQQARQGNGQQAGERAEQAAGKLEETARQLEGARQQQAQQQAEAQQQALRQAADDALSLARRQSAVGEQMEGADREELSELRGDVAAVQQGVRNMAESLSSNSGAGGGTDRALSTLLGQAMQALDRAAGAMESRTGSGSTPSEASQEAVSALNQVALMAMAGAEQAARGGDGQGQQDLQQMIESLAQRQGQLNNQAGQIMPMQLGQQAMRSQMQQLSQGQQGVADELGRLADEPGSDQTLGDLQALAREAEELARQLEGGRLDAPTRERQERLFHRLLDAGRSLEKEEYSDERESRSPGAFQRGEAVALSPEALDALQFRLPGAAALMRLTPAERRLVLEYFERLNREGRKDRGAPPTPPGGSPGGSP